MVRARVHYTLATSFYLPPTSIVSLRKSIALYGKATELSNSPLLLLDAAFNLGQAYISLADILEDSGQSANRTRDVEIRKLREEAARVLGEVLDGQEEFLIRMRENAGDSEAADETIEEVEGDAGELGEEGQMEVDEGENGAGDEEDNGEEDSFETYLPTPSTFIDTALLLVDLHLSMWEAIEPPLSPPEDAQLAVRSVLDRAGQLIPPGRQAELDLAEIKVLLSVDRIVWDMYRADARAGSGTEKSVEGAVMVLTRLLASLDTSPPDEPTLRAEILVILADTHTALANRSVWLLPQLGSGPSPLAQQAWYHYSQAIGVLGKALDLPTSPQTPREFRSSVLLSLSKTSLERGKLALGDVNDTAKRNAVQLMENAINYCVRALDGLGWKGFDVMTKTTGSVPSLSEPPQSGWDSESLARDAQLHLMRVCYFGAKTEILPEDKRGVYKTGLERIATVLKKVTAARRMTGKDVTSWLEGVEEDGRVSEEERAWWSEFGKAL